ncbi:hypothetical protein ACFSKT_00005 [Paenibacillus xanthanilyticus]|uniref:hypothetical protein n=1 Tax=Paenibacillus xanthanilyticus TaxID=1783531 RepID=UPI00363B354F
MDEHRQRRHSSAAIAPVMAPRLQLPSAPILNSPHDKRSCSLSPVKSSGVAFTSVSLMLPALPAAPARSTDRPAKARRRPPP